MFGRKRSRSRESGASQGTEEIVVAADVERENDDHIPDLGSNGDFSLGPDQAMEEAYEVTRNHPIGRLLLKNLTDLTNLAKKTNAKESEVSIGEFCLDFKNALELERNQLDEKIKENNVRFERTLIDKELDSHKINASFTPPTEWGTHPTLTNVAKITAANKAFPGMGKFRGFARDGYLNIIEYFAVLRTAQEQCRLSEKEFIEKMILASTGEAHEIITYCRDQGESLSDIYHNLVMRFDDRITVEEAKSRLQSFKATKNMNLAKVESQIMIWANRASAQYPIGESRQAFYNLEACQALIRALPTSSQITASTAYNSLTARLQMAPSYSYFTRALNSHRAIMDKDIRSNGTEPGRFGKNLSKKPSPQSRGSYKNFKRPSYSAYAVSMNTTGAEAGSQTPFKGKTFANSSKPVFNSAVYRNDGNSYKPKFNSYNRGSANFVPLNTRGKGNFGNRSNFPPRQYKGNFSSRGNSSGRPTNFNNSSRNGKRTNFQQKSNLNCSLCGYKNHKATDCRNIRDDSGTIKQIIPTMGVCGKCPQSIQVRLHHPEVYCPFRTPHGIFSNRKN